jgi:hypothetical protein
MAKQILLYCRWHRSCHWYNIYHLCYWTLCLALVWRARRGSHFWGQSMLDHISHDALIAQHQLTFLPENSRPNPSSGLLVRARNDAVYYAAVVPHRSRTDSPFPTDVVIVSGVDVEGKEVKQLI